TLVIIFLIFSGMVQELGGLPYIINLSRRLTSRFTWGLTQIPVIASLFFGTFSGSAAANAAGVGVVTIPMMKKVGLSPHLAAAIEAVASSGGQIMPPVMGVAAFLMSQFLGIPYIRIVFMGFPPAIIFYVCTAFAVYLQTRDLLGKTHGSARQDDVSKDFHITDGVSLAIALGVLLFALAYLLSSVLVAGVWMIISYIITWFIFTQARNRFSLSGLVRSLKSPFTGLLTGAGQVVGIIGLLCTMGIAAKMLVASGLTQKLSYLMVDLSGGHLPLLLLLIFVVGIVLGMAVSTAVVYIVVVLLAAPALMQFGIQPYVAHFTVFYIATLASITPPVAIAVAVTASIAGSPYMKTSWMACKVGISLFILPFVFITKPALLAANLTTMPLAFMETTIGLLAVIYGLHRHSRGFAGFGIRFLFLVLGALVVFTTQNVILWPSMAAILFLGGLLLFLGKRIPGSAVSAVPGPGENK
ncbi:MAG: TRAP transporter large permease subunit, partial [Dehalococcoidales bacterium]|nr:TRAP transporter large permease subunit [Dehalococcoidales bacterium]